MSRAQLEGYSEKPPKKHRIAIFILIIFLILVSLFLYFAFFKENGFRGITGFFIGGLNDENAVFIKAELNPPDDFKTSEKIKRIELDIDSSKDFLVGKQKIDLSKFNSANIIIDNFNGELSLEEDSIKSLKGKASNVFINNIPISSQSGGNMKVSFDNSFRYKFLKLEKVFIPSLVFKTSGKLTIGNNKAIINLEDENFEIEKFEGDITFEKNKFLMNGLVDKSKLPELLDITDSEKS
ncbi:hypothetical protein GF386_05570 [Candidatus Pacearchaeota archaeon]|nr:hypothetical protein [Candidatus Pacearchaeota archaeon]MBD3283569.1 hypothetical protein [Candidatus Pacearchaeota archaeon]